MSCGCGLAVCDCGAEGGVYRVLKAKYAKTGETTLDAEGRVIKWQKVAEWLHLGFADGMEDAKRKFGGAPVLEFIGRVH